MKFWDTSAIVPLIADESRSKELKQLAASDPSMVVWLFTPIEVMSGVWRKHRERTDDVARANSERRLSELERRWTVVGRPRQ